MSTLLKTQWHNGDFDIALESGDIVGVLGQNGAGKTTLLQKIAGLDATVHDQVFLYEKPLKQYSAIQRAQAIGFLFQDTHDIFPQTVLEYCLAARYAYRIDNQNAVLSVLSKMQLMHLQHRRITTLSGGERRRVAIASVMIQSPRIYFLDEPTNHLDLRYQIEVLQQFNELAQQGAAIMMALHDVRMARDFCNKILVLLDQGECVFGTAEDVLCPENIARMLQTPLEKIYTSPIGHYLGLRL